MTNIWSSAEEKWKVQNGLVMLLPRFQGQGQNTLLPD